MFPRYFRYSIGSTGQSIGMGDDRSINSFYSRRLLISSSLLKNEKKKKKKKRNLEVIDGEGDEMTM